MFFLIYFILYLLIESYTVLMQVSSCKCILYLSFMLEQIWYLALFNHITLQIILHLILIGVYFEF